MMDDVRTEWEARAAEVFELRGMYRPEGTGVSPEMPLGRGERQGAGGLVFFVVVLFGLACGSLGQSGNFSCLMAPAGPWELAFFVLASGLIFRA